jgi:nucleoside-diphosphate-sugar epimerase
VAAAVVELLDSDYAGTLNLGTGTLTPVRRVVDLLRELSGCPIEDRDVPVQGPMRFQCDMTTLHRIVDWRPRVDVEEGVRRTWEAMRSYAGR